MNVTTWYAAVVVGGFTVLLLYRVISRIIRFLCTLSTFFLLKYLVYPYIWRGNTIPGRPTRIFLLSVTSYVIANILCMTIGVGSFAQIGTRAGMMSLANMIPVVAGSLSMAANYLGVSVQTQHKIHACMGTVTFLQGLVHAVTPFINRQPFTLNTSGIWGLVGGSSLALIYLLSTHFIRRAVYEFFFQFHMLLSKIFVFALWLHVKGNRTAELYLLIGASAWASSTALKWIFCLYRNFSWNRSRTKAEVTQESGALHVSVYIPRPWKMKAGQYIYLSIPKVSFWSIFQRHPFVISGWDSNSDRLKIHLLIKPRRGFTRKLTGCTDTLMSAFVDGPYGVGYDFSNFGTVLMFATGIGVASHLAYIDELVQGYRRSEVKTRRIVLMWELDADGQQSWVKPFMDQLLIDDTEEYNIKVEMYLPWMEKPEKEYGKRIKAIRGTLDIANVLQEKLAVLNGKTVISVSARIDIRDKIRDYVSYNLHQDLRLVDLEFQPPNSRSKQLDFSCKGLPK